MKTSCRQAGSSDVANVCFVLQEAATWLHELGQSLWQLKELSEDAVREDIAAGNFYLFEVEGEPAGTLKFQLEDGVFWPDVPALESAFVHRIAIRRAFSGGELSSAMLRWAVEQARTLDRQFLRLDCESSRPKLRGIYERYGFTHRDDRQVGPYLVSRYELRL